MCTRPTTLRGRPSPVPPACSPPSRRSRSSLSRASSSSAAAPTLAQLVGQHLLVRMQGSTPSAAFLRRIREGEIGGVVLVQDNATPAGVAALVAKLQAAAHAGGQLPLLVAVDQEGGIVKRLPGPPTAAPGAMKSA